MPRDQLWPEAIVNDLCFDLSCNGCTEKMQNMPAFFKILIKKNATLWKLYVNLIE